ncbi:MAG: cytochrome C [bacterium]
MIKAFIKPVYFIIFLTAIAGIFACAASGRTVKEHPEKVTGLPVCGDCHDDERKTLNHTPIFSTRHKIYARRNVLVCGMCHKESFCSDCHAHKEEINAAYKHKDSPARFFPHRGDYLTQHKIEGRINPVSCVKCHGRQNNERCKLCHK